MNRKEQTRLFHQCLGEHLGILRHVARGFAAGPDQEDLMQEIMLALWHALPAFRGEASRTTFIYRVAQNTALTWRRSVRHRHLDEELDESRHAAAPPEQRLERGESLYRAIRRLPVADRSLILLQLDELGYREIAGITGLSESNVGVRLNRIRRRLAILIEEESS